MTAGVSQTPVRFTLSTAATWSDPWPMYAALRDHDPVHHVVPEHRPEHDYYVLSRHADVWRAARDPETFSSARGLTVNYDELELIGLADNPHVHSVELDYVSGTLARDAEAYREMWGGLALAVMLPEPLAGSLVVSARADELYRITYRRSAHWPLDPRSLTKRVIRKCRKIAGLG